MPAPSHASNEATNCSRDTGMATRPWPGVQPHCTSGSSMWWRSLAASMWPLRAGSLVCSHRAPELIPTKTSFSSGLGMRQPLAMPGGTCSP